MMKTKICIKGILVSASLCFLGVSFRAHAAPEVIAATAKIRPLKDGKVQGTVIFTKTEKGMLVKAEITGLTPGEHGFHIHEKGDCSAPDGSTAGGHFNPGGTSHGGCEGEHRHAGDMGNLVADSAGNAKLEVVVQGISFEGTNSILKRSVIVHEKKDDLKTQPSGDSGPRIACGVIEAGKF